MARRKTQEPVMEELDLHELIKGTNISIVSETAGVMHGRDKVPTPLPSLNCLFGGGIPLSILAEVYGVNASGKSSFSYQTMGNFQKEYPEGVSIIVDTEASVDATRLPYMGVDPKRTLRLPATTMESGFEQLFKVLEKKNQSEKLRSIPVFIIYDTIAVQTTNAQFEQLGMNSAGMMIKSRLLKHYLSILMPYIENQPICCILLNQVTTEMTQFGSRLSSSGGHALKHDIHLRIRFNSGDTAYDGVFAKKKYSSINIEKSKISPLMNNFNVVLDINKGGVINSHESMINFATEQLGLIDKGSWSNSKKLAEKYPEYSEKFDKFLSPWGSYRFQELLDYVNVRPKFSKFLELCFLDLIEENYSYQAEVCKAYKERVLKELEEPELVTQEDGSVIDIWSGEIVSEAPKEKEEVEVSEVAKQGLEPPVEPFLEEAKGRFGS